MRQSIILIILDGWGIGRTEETNPIYIAQPQFSQYAEKYFPYGTLQSSGIAIGLPWGEPGNSEIGHLTIGAGRTLFQHYLKISFAIDDKSFFSNQKLKNAFEHAKQNKSTLHLIGLLSKGAVHSSLKHLLALIEMAKQEKCEELSLHLFTDGRDSPPHSSLDLLKQVEEKLKKSGNGSFSSIAGRFYAMDRAENWDRTEKTYLAFIGKGKTISSPETLIQQTYQKNLSDEYVEPTIIENSKPIKNNDSIIFFNFREDRMRQITSAFIDPNFNKFPTEKFSNLHITTMTNYHKHLKLNTAFPEEKLKNILSEVLAINGKSQLRIAETEKYAHITYFFNSLREEVFPNEFRVLIPSIKTLKPAEHPEMRAEEITSRLLSAIDESGFDFILVNYANPDIIAHTGNFSATLSAIKIIDKVMGQIIQAVLKHNHTLIITSDHGNAEALLDSRTGEEETEHNSNPVPFYLINRSFEQQNQNSDIYKAPNIGILSDIAPTILDLMKIPQPKEMTGESLLKQLI